MTLVVFNYDSERDGLLVDGVFEETLELPRHVHNKNWVLRSVNATLSEIENFAGIEVSFPEIMNTQNILFSNVSLGNVAQPEKSFRFYKKSYQLSEDVVGVDREASCFSVVSEYPNLKLGEHRLENTRITCRIRSFGGRGGETSKLNSSCIILSFEE
jgi:hypothetical protein